ncbi:MAG: cation:proton antiporter [Actinomycetota bacterium]|nr:cation:proton antiporter [Actinomycetota bacterium]
MLGPLAVQAEASGLPSLDILSLLGVLLVAWTAGRIAVRSGYPAILGELLAGILLGPAVLGLLSPAPGLKAVGELGILLMMLYIGMEIAPDDLRRASWPGLLAAAGGFIVPFVLGYAVVIAFAGTQLAALFVAISVGVTSLATKSRILIDLDLLDTRIAHVLMSAALLSDTATLVGFAAIIGFVELGAFHLAGTVRVALEALAFFGVAGVVGWFGFPLVGRLVSRGRITDRALGFAFVVGVGLLYAELAELAGLHAILGAFVAGLLLREDVLPPRLDREVDELLQAISIGFLAPVFFVTAGFQIDPDVFRTDLALLLAIIAVAMFGKILGTMLFYIPSGHGWREGLTVGAAMNGRGAVEIVVAGIGLELGLISVEIFTILVFMAIVTTATVPVLLTLGTRWLRRRGELARSEERRRGAVIIGAGPLGRTFATALRGRPVWLLDSNRRQVAAARAQGLNAIYGNALDEQQLRRAGVSEARTLLALTSNAEVNVLASQLAREEFAVPHVFAAVASAPPTSLFGVLERAGAHQMLDTDIDVERWDRWISNGEATLFEVPIEDDASIDRLTQQLRSAEEHLPLAVLRRGDRILYPQAGDLLADDRVTVLTRDPLQLSGRAVPASSDDSDDLLER